MQQPGAEFVLINPPLSLEERYGDFAKSGTETPPLGLAQLAAVTREAGFQTAIIDSQAEGMGYETILDRLKSLQVKVVGLTAVTISILSAANLAKAIKKANPAIKTIIGGPHVTAVPKETMTRFPQFDVAVIGEGELTIVELLKALAEGSSIREVQGLAFLEDGEFVETEPRQFITNLDDLPMYAWDLLPNLVDYYQTPTFTLGASRGSSLITSRGCFGKCTFCDRRVFGNKIRSHSGKRVFEMMTKLVNDYGIEEIIIHDDSFVTKHKILKEVCHLLIESKMKLAWGCNARVDVINPEVLKLMRQAGCNHIGLGIESGNQKILDTINKGVTLEQIEKAVIATHAAGIHVRGFFMIGHPGETVETIKDTIDLALRLPIDDFQVTLFTPLPGSEIYENADQYGTLNRDWQKMNMWNPAFVPHGLSVNELTHWQKRAFRSFYFRPSVVWNYAKRIRDFSSIKKLIRGLLTLVGSVFKRS